MLLAAISVMGNFCNGAALESELYYIQMVSLNIPRKTLADAVSAKRGIDAMADSLIYTEVYRNGTLIWRSPMKELSGHNEEYFYFDSRGIEYSFPLFWKPQDRIVCKTMIIEKELAKRSANATAGGVGGALAGAGIGAVGAGVCTGGLGAPAGAAIGAIIGFFGGGAVGAVAPINGAREVAAFSYAQSEKFNLFIPQKSDKLAQDTPLDEGLNSTLTLTGKMLTAADRKQNGELVLQNKYAVRLRSLFISSKNPAVSNHGEYYLEIDPNGTGNDTMKIELGNLPSDTVIPMDSLFLLKNQGGDSVIRVYRKMPWYRSNKPVFNGTQYRTDGHSWVYLGKSADDYGSYMVMETFDVQK